MRKDLGRWAWAIGTASATLAFLAPIAGWTLFYGRDRELLFPALQAGASLATLTIAVIAGIVAWRHYISAVTGPDLRLQVQIRKDRLPDNKGTVWRRICVVLVNESEEGARSFSVQLWLGPPPLIGPVSERLNPQYFLWGPGLVVGIAPDGKPAPHEGIWRIVNVKTPQCKDTTRIPRPKLDLVHLLLGFAAVAMFARSWPGTVSL